MNLLKKWRLRKRMMAARAEFAAANLKAGRVPVKCVQCPVWTWGATEEEAYSEMRWHLISSHVDTYPEYFLEEEDFDVREA